MVPLTDNGYTVDTRYERSREDSVEQNLNVTNQQVFITTARNPLEIGNTR